MNISIRIERLILDGLPVGLQDARAVQAAVERELARLLSDQGIGLRAQTGGAFDFLPAGSIQLGHGLGVTPIGKEIGRAIHDALADPVRDPIARETPQSPRRRENGTVAPRSTHINGTPR